MMQTIKVPAALLALMSADNPTSKNAEGVYTFKMDKPIPAYLLAFLWVIWLLKA
jgi:leukotriene-A4 hydrolase